nr:integrase, catalytic core [Tanacetum cinerariifolium]
MDASYVLCFVLFRFEDYELGGKVKYGLDRWIDVMNKEMEALNRNNTWEICDLPKGRRPIKGVDYEETFSPVVKMVTVRCVLSLVVQKDWAIFQLDVNNAFLYEDLVEDIYMSLPEGYFVNNDNRVWIEVIKNNNGLSFSQRKYCLEILNNFGILGCKLASTPIEVSQTKVNGKILAKDDYPLVSFGNFQKLVGKLIYLTMTRPDISYAVHKLSQAMHGLLNSDLKLAFRVLRYLKGAPGKGVFLRKSKKQSVLAKSFAKAEYRAMSNVACEIIWILKLLIDLKVDYTIPMNMFCDRSAAMQIDANPVFHERTKHFEIDLYF